MSDGARAIECYHDKIRETLAAQLRPALQHELWAGLSRALLAEVDPDPELLTRCLLGAGMSEDAGEQAARGAARALQGLAFDRAARLYDQALEHGRFGDARVHEIRVGRADALALAGRGVIAGEAYLEARTGASAVEAMELTRKAGEQYLMCGSLDRGRELLGEALRPLGISMPQSPAAAFASLLWSRARLRLRGLRFKPRGDQDAATLRSLEALGTATLCLVRSDPLRFADFSARWIRLALVSGHSGQLARALPYEVELAAFMRTKEARVNPIIERADALCEQTGDPRARQYFLFCRGGYRLIRSWPMGSPEGDIEGARADYERFIGLLKTNPYPNSSYDEPWAQFFPCERAVVARSRVAEASQVAQVQFDAAWSRNDMSTLPNWAFFGSVVHPAVGKEDLAERELERVRAAWRCDEVALPDVMFLLGATALAAYRGQLRERRPGIATAVARLRGALVTSVVFAPIIDQIRAWSHRGARRWLSRRGPSDGRWNARPGGA